MDRRRFLALSAAALAASRLARPAFAFSRTTGTDPRPTVVETEGSSPEKITALLAALGGIDLFLPGEKSRATVVLKPNLCLPDPAHRATTTTLDTVEAFCRAFITAGVKRIIVADHTLRATEDFRDNSLFALEKRYTEVKVILANEERLFQPIEVNGSVLKRVDTLRMLARADLFINLATAKHHSATHVSLGIKNLMGCIWNRAAFHTDMDLAQAIGDLALAVRPALTVIDATRVLLNGGPTGPGPIKTDNRLFASRDVLAVDSVVTSRYGFGGKSLSAREVPHLAAAFRNGVGEIDLQKIELRKV